jgi:hypothetical protein
MKQLAYSSSAAFLAHYRALSDAAAGRDGTPALSVRDHETLEAMEQLLEVLKPDERTMLAADAASGDDKRVSDEEWRRRERAHLKLRRLLLTKGVLRG